jgi:flavorubredoxin
LTTDGELPLSACSLFVFEHTKLPECILRIDREGGILIACDSLQNWLAPDAFFSDESRKMMSDMGFFQAANVGPVWMQVNDPKAPDFQRLNQLAFKHVLCGHGSPLLDHGQHAFADRFKQVFGI